MLIKKCMLEDVAKLAVLNKQLIDDEKSDNPINHFMKSSCCLKI